MTPLYRWDVNRSSSGDWTHKDGGRKTLAVVRVDHELVAVTTGAVRTVQELCNSRVICVQMYYN